MTSVNTDDHTNISTIQGMKRLIVVAWQRYAADILHKDKRLFTRKGYFCSSSTENDDSSIENEILPWKMRFFHGK